MITEVIQTKTILLQLTEQEAEWLRGNMQNPLHSHMLEEEDKSDSEMRLKFFYACSQGLAK